MNPHDPFFRSLLATKQHAVELLEYLKHANPSLKNTLKNVNLQTLTRIPGDYSNTEEFGYADLAFTANVNSDIIIRIGILMEHKSFKDENVLNQLYKYHYHLMRDNILGLNVMSPTIALIIYNGQEKWNPIEKIYKAVPKELVPLLFPFKTEFVDISAFSNEACEHFTPKLALGLFALKHIWNFEKFKPYFEKYSAILKNTTTPDDYMDFIHQIDVYFKKKVSTEYKEAFTMDFVKPPYKTIWDSEIEEATEKGHSEGRVEGLSEGKRQVAKAMLANGLAISLVANISGLTEEELKNL